MAAGAKALIFSEATSSDAFAERFSASRDNQLSQLIATAVTHVHDLIKQFRPTQDEWRKVIAFLTEVGHASDERRQEWVLLSDLIGASALVEEINSRRPKGATPNTIRGPFFRNDAPERALGSSISLDGVGEPLLVSARVQDLDGLPIADAEVVTWQANGEGFYENQQPDLQPEHNLRGLFRTDRDGQIRYHSVMPAGYGVPDDGPVGRLLTASGCPLRRPANLHFVIRADGFETITTHIYDANDPHLCEDALFGVRPELITGFAPAVVSGQKGKAVNLTFVMVRAKPGRAV
ncbi:dioxygenase family protein [Rhizobium hidalgonense]|uniref:dioxygenase family protein n=1 Tax=Rhizobium hidalgonense TaxID=1538159 RepID=UPI0028714705|nr:dioxygenase [Rhizobium hidalgonense]MDR9805628.1 dioxygenase [Rhizobium hidalgonense]